jgi:hypothetical protein
MPKSLSWAKIGPSWQLLREQVDDTRTPFSGLKQLGRPAGIAAGAL